MMILWICLWIAAALLAVYIIRRARNEAKADQELVKRLRSTELYGHIYPQFRSHDDIYLESLTLRPEGIVFRMVIPLGTVDRYTFQRHGMDNLSKETLYALSQAALVDLKVLRNSAWYAFRTHTDRLPNGSKLVWYEYQIRARRKKQVLRIAAMDEEEGTSL